MGRLRSEPTSPSASQAELVNEVAAACRILAGEGYTDLTLGHVSARSHAEPTRILIKRRGVTLTEVTPGDVISFQLDDDLSHRDDMHLEAALHIEVYRRRPDVGAVVHGHPPYATAFSATDAVLEPLTHDGLMFPRGLSYYDGIPGLITEAEQGRAVAEALGDSSVVLLRNHGVLIAEKNVPWTVLAAVTLERAIMMQSIASGLGRLRPIPAEQVAEISELKYQDGLVAEYWRAWLRELDRGGRDARGNGRPS